MTETFAGPNKAAVKHKRAPRQVPIRTAVENPQKQHSDETTRSKQAPEPGECSRSGRVWVVPVILGKKLRDPVSRPLLRAHVSKNAKEKGPNHRFAEEAAVHLHGAGPFVGGTFHARKAAEDKNRNHRQGEHSEDPVHGSPGKGRRR